MSHTLEPADQARVRAENTGTALPCAMLLRPRCVGAPAAAACGFTASLTSGCDMTAASPGQSHVVSRASHYGTASAPLRPAAPGPDSGSSSSATTCCSPACGAGATSTLISSSNPTSGACGSPAQCTLGHCRSRPSLSPTSPTCDAAATSATSAYSICRDGAARDGEHQMCAPRIHGALLPISTDDADSTATIDVPLATPRWQQPSPELAGVRRPAPATSHVPGMAARTLLLRISSRATRRTFLDPLDCYRVSAPAALLGYSAAAGEPAPLLPCSRVRYALAALEETAGVSVQQLRPAPRAVSACASGQASAFASAAAAGCVVRAPGPQVLGGLPAVPHLLPAASAPAAGGQRCTTGGLADGEVDSAGALRAMAPPPLRVLSARSELIMVAARSSSPHLEPGTVDRRSDGGSSAAAAGTDGSPTHMTPGSTSASTSSNGNTNRSDASVVVRSSSQLCGVPTVAAQDLLRCRDPCSAAAAVTAAAAAWQDSQRAAAAGVQYDDDAAAAAAFPTAYLTDALAVQPPVAAGADTPKAPVGDAHVPPMDACRATCYENPLAAAYGTIGPDVDCSYRNPLCRVNDTGGGDGGDGGGCGGGDEDEGTEDVIAMPVMPLNVLLTWSIAGGRGGSSRGGSGGGAPSGGGNGGGGVLGAACCTESVGSSCAGGSEKLVGGHAGSPMGGLVRTLHGPAGGGSQQQAAARK